MSREVNKTKPESMYTFGPWCLTWVAEDVLEGYARSRDITWDYNGDWLGKITFVPRSKAPSEFPPFVQPERAARYDCYIFSKWGDTSSGSFKLIGESDTYKGAKELILNTIGATEEA